VKKDKYRNEVRITVTVIFICILAYGYHFIHVGDIPAIKPKFLYFVLMFDIMG